MIEVRIRKATPKDAGAIVSVHREAVHRIACADYPSDVLNEWSEPVTPERIEKLRKNHETIEGKLVIAEEEGKIIGFGEVSFSDRMILAVYVSPAALRRGVGRAILNDLEKASGETGIEELRLESSLTAETFYAVNGYEVTKRSFHTLQSGRSMACVKMVKRIL